MRKHFYLLLSTCFLLLYAVTAQRGVSWQDSGLFQYRVLDQDYLGFSGLALAHPFYIVSAGLFTSLFPTSCRFFALNLFSGVGMSLALFFLTRILSHLKLKQSTILIIVLALGLAHLTWWMSTIAEVYTWSLAFLMAELLCVAKLCGQEAGGSGSAFAMPTADKQEAEEETQKTASTTWLWLLLALLNGLHASLHNFAFLNLPIYALLFVYLQYRRGLLQSAVLLFLTAFAWFLGSSLIVTLFYFEWATSHTFTGTVKSLLFGHGYEDVVLGVRTIDWPLAKLNLLLASVSLLNPAWLFVCLAGRTRNRHTTFKMALLGLTVIHVLFWIRYFVPDQATFILPSLALLSLWAGIGLDSVPLKPNLVVALALSVLLSAITFPLLIHKTQQANGVIVKRARELPFRDETKYWLFPWKHAEQSASCFVAEVRKTISAGDVLIADSTAAGPLLAAQATGLLSPKLRILSPFTNETDDELVHLIATTERVYIVSPVAGYASRVLLTGQYTFEKENALYRVRSTRHE
jgi:hypothetical protein